MFVDKRIHVYQKQKGTTRRNQRNESTSISFIWTILSLPLHARLIDTLPSKARQGFFREKKTNRHVFLRHVFFSDTTIPIFDSPSFAYRPPIFDPSISEPDLCQSSVGFTSKVPVSYGFQRLTSEHPFSSRQTSACI